ncbi:MAG: histidine kinase [Sphaerochaeta sp.]|nr:histidine kinase [Sphaerochaeta sp.]
MTKNLLPPIKLQTILTILFAGLLALSVSVISLLSFNLYKTELVTSFATSRMDTLMQISQAIEKDQKELVIISDLFYQNDELLRHMAASEKQLTNEEFFRFVEREKQRTDKTLHYLDIKYELQVFSNNGLFYTSDLTQVETLLTFPKKQWYYYAKKNRNDSLWLSNISFSNSKGKKNMVSYVRFVQNAQQEIVGAILINLDERDLNKRYTEIVTKDSNIYLVDHEGKIVTHSIESIVGRLFYNMKVFDEYFKDKNYAEIEKTGEKYLYSRYISTNNPWIVVEEIPMTSITNPLKAVSQSIFIIAMAVLITGIGLSIISAYFVSKPLAIIARSMHKAGQGDLGVTFTELGCAETRDIAQECQNFVQEIQELLEDVQHKEAEKRTSELNFLQMQLNPHFMYNTLFTIKCMIDMGRHTQACETLDSFTDMLKKVLQINTPMITIADNIEYLDDYTFIMKQRYGENLSIIYDIEKGMEELHILKFMLQPIIENSIYHGFSQGIEENSVIILSIRTEANHILIQVRDNGCGMSAETSANIFTNMEKERTKHIGLYNVYKQLELYYDHKASITIDSEQGKGTTVSITVPISEHD